MGDLPLDESGVKIVVFIGSSCGCCGPCGMAGCRGGSSSLSMSLPSWIRVSSRCVINRIQSDLIPPALHQDEPFETFSIVGTDSDSVTMLRKKEVFVGS